jgi:HD-GYP domain-containing protein (c-di-GMP phosphodiesterase class II)
VSLTPSTRTRMWIVRTADAGQKDAVTRLHAIVAGIDAADLHHHDHSANVARYSVALGRAFRLDAGQLSKLQRAAFLHDAGKAGIPGSILTKRGPLTPSEAERMQAHPAEGAALLEAAGLLEEARWVRSHHEREDGRGYPDGLAGPEIPFEARILAVADSFEAMTSDRPYRAGMLIEDALEELRRCSGGQFDPTIVTAFVRLVERGRLRVHAVRTATAATPPSSIGSAPSRQRRGRDEGAPRHAVGRAPPAA